MKAEYIDHFGDDLRVVNSARVSFAKQSELENGKLPPKDVSLIKYLAKHGHWTPFSHPQVTFRETVPIAVARQRFKHTVGFTYNEVSRRYVDSPPEFFYPGVWRSRPIGSVKQGSGAPIKEQNAASDVYYRAVDTAMTAYRSLLDAGVAPEQARLVLPQSAYTSYYVTGSLYAWFRAFNQRVESSAQQEIQELAAQWGDVLSVIFPVSWSALTEASSHYSSDQEGTDRRGGRKDD